MASSLRRILHVTTGLSLGGAEALLVECVRSGQRRGFESHVATLVSGGEYGAVLQAEGVPVTELDARANRPNLPALLRLCKTIRALRPQVVQAWMVHANLFTLTAASLAGASARTHVGWGLFCEPHQMQGHHFPKALVERCGALLSRLPAGIVYNAHRAARDHVACGYLPRRTVLVNNGVDVSRFRPDQVARVRLRRALGIHDDTPVVVMAARNHPQKDWPTALAGVRNVDGLLTLAVGKGTEELPEQERLLRLGLRMDMPDIYAASDFFMLPSAFGEGTSVAMSEAMATGLPVIVTDVGDNGTFGSQAGFVVPTGDVAALRDRVAQLARCSNQRVELGLAARRLAEREFSVDTNFAPLFDFYDDLPDSRQ